MRIAFDEIVRLVKDELVEARTKYPGNKQRLYAFIEESGEVTKAFLDMQQGKSTTIDIKYELIQSIAMAVRLLQEGDSDFPEY